MASGTSESPITTKTEFARYLDANPGKVYLVASVRIRYGKANPTGRSFGFWLRSHYSDDFNRAYHQWWLRRPELYGRDYCEDLLAVSVYR